MLGTLWGRMGGRREIGTNSNRMLKDERLRKEDQRSIFDVKEAANKLG